MKLSEQLLLLRNFSLFLFVLVFILFFILTIQRFKALNYYKVTFLFNKSPKAAIYLAHSRNEAYMIFKRDIVFFDKCHITKIKGDVEEDDIKFLRKGKY